MKVSHAQCGSFSFLYDDRNNKMQVLFYSEASMLLREAAKKFKKQSKALSAAADALDAIDAEAFLSPTPTPSPEKHDDGKRVRR